MNVEHFVTTHRLKGLRQPGDGVRASPYSLPISPWLDVSYLACRYTRRNEDGLRYTTCHPYGQIPLQSWQVGAIVLRYANQYGRAPECHSEAYSHARTWQEICAPRRHRCQHSAPQALDPHFLSASPCSYCKHITYAYPPARR